MLQHAEEMPQPLSFSRARPGVFRRAGKCPSPPAAASLPENRTLSMRL